MNNISYKNKQTVQPLYVFYSETDLDSLDDQPVDYSKRYTDQDSYDDRHRRKSNVNPNQFPAPETSQIVKSGCRNYNDEVRVYCIEGTPVTISSASSFCDLREVGNAHSLQKPGSKRCFPLTNDDGLSQEPLEVKKSTESYGIQKDESLAKEKDEANKEVKSVSFRDGEDISKASTPMMFSRSSSVCSLNSFEQHSIIDDRSSVSAISALTSGIISPSDIPDSPGEVMSPVFTDKAFSPKIDSSKVCSDNECDDMEVCEKEKIVPEDILDSKVNNPAIAKCKEYLTAPSDKPEMNSEDENNIFTQQFECLNNSSEMDEVFADEEYERDGFILKSEREYLTIPSDKPEINSEDENNIFAQQLECLNNSSEVDEVFTDQEYERDGFILKSERDSVELLSSKSDVESDEDDELLQHYIQLGMPDKTPEIKYDINEQNAQHHAYSQNVSSQMQLQVKKETGMLNGKSIVYEQKDITSSNRMSEEFPTETSSDIQVSYSCKLLSQENQSIQNVEMKIANSAKSNDDSEDDDELLQKCIQLGMPKQPSNNATGPNNFVKTKYLHQHISHNERNDSSNQSSMKFGEEDSDEDDILLQQCIQRGMPKITEEKMDPPVYERMECHNVLLKNNGSKHDHCKTDAIKSNKDSLHRHQLLAQHCIQYPIVQKLHRGTDSTVADVASHPTPSLRNKIENDEKKTYPVKTEEDSDGDEDDILMQNCIQLGMPKETTERKRLHSRVLNKPVRPPSSINLCSPNDLRDNCPDGVSDGDEDDDLIANCIRAGMSISKTTNDVQSRLHSSQTVNTQRKLQSPSHPYKQNSSTESSKKFGPRLPPNQPYAPVHSSTAWVSSSSFIDVDCMRIYRTEDTPVLSPTASISDLSSLSFNESFLNNSRNSDCSSESDDEMLLQCIRSGMPVAKRAVA